MYNGFLFIVGNLEMSVFLAILPTFKHQECFLSKKKHMDQCKSLFCTFWWLITYRSHNPGLISKHKWLLALPGSGGMEYYKGKKKRKSKGPFKKMVSEGSLGGLADIFCSGGAGIFLIFNLDNYESEEIMRRTLIYRGLFQKSWLLA